MLLRCSVCKGQFDVDPDMKKPTVFCSHCGAQLQTVNPGRRRAPNNNAAVGALSGEQLPGTQQEVITEPPAPALGGFVEEFEAPPAEHGAAPIQPVASDNFSSYPGANMPPSSSQYSPAAGPRRPVRRKKDNMMIIVIVLVAVFVVAIGVTCAILFMGPEEKKVAPKKEEDNMPNAGELYKNVPTGKRDVK
jgi:hypothetical protein